jgi:hypothetical protein
MWSDHHHLSLPSAPNTRFLMSHEVLYFFIRSSVLFSWHQTRNAIPPQSDLPADRHDRTIAGCIEKVLINVLPDDAAKPSDREARFPSSNSLTVRCIDRAGRLPTPSKRSLFVELCDTQNPGVHLIISGHDFFRSPFYHWINERTRFFSFSSLRTFHFTLSTVTNLKIMVNSYKNHITLW